MDSAELESLGLTHEDVLPSFEMHNYLFNRSVYDNLESRNNGLPVYSEEAPQVTTSSSIEHEHDPLQEPHLLIANNFGTLKRKNSPIKITIEITKASPIFAKKSEPANPLKEYKPGDFIHGIIRLENPTDKDIDFEMFLVSLEGTLTIPVGSTTDQLRLKRMTFLKTFDIFACFVDQRFDTTTPFCELVDSTDGHIFGLPNDKLLRPGVKYKKHFTFRLPETLLDDFCEHSYFNHFKELPPSFGNDIESFGGDSNNIEINSTLGYGRLPQRGSQIVTKDYSTKGQSVQYSINARLIAPNDSEEFKNYGDNFKFAMIKETQHYFRFVPIPLERLHTDDDLAKLADTRHFHPLSTTKQFDNYLGLLDSKLKELEERLKLKNAGVIDENEIQSILNDTIPKPKCKLGALEGCSVEDKRKIQKLIDEETGLINDENKEMNIYEYEVPLYKNSVLKKAEPIGSIKVKCKIPHGRSLKYIIPKTLAKMSLDERATHGSSISSLSTSDVSRSNSLFETTNASVVTPATTYNTPTTEKPPQLQSVKSSDVSWLEHIEVELLFVPIKNETRPPDISDSKQILTAITFMTTDPMPVTIDADFFTDLKENLTPRTLLFNTKSQFSKKFDQLKELCSVTGTNLPKSLYHDLLSIINMKITESYIPLFKDHSYNKDTLKWTAVQIPDIDSSTKTSEKSQRIAWKSTMKVPLNINESVSRNISIVPNFENCFVSRFYGVKLKLNFKKYSTGNPFIVPVRVAKP